MVSPRGVLVFFRFTPVVRFFRNPLQERLSWSEPFVALAHTPDLARRDGKKMRARPFGRYGWRCGRPRPNAKLYALSTGLL
jgi:hypothetical protein